MGLRKPADDPAAVDPSIYDYDAHYDALEASRSQSKSKASSDSQDRAPRYMSGLLSAAKIRERDHLRAKDKMLQKERENEGDEFKDKEKFVTSSYKQQQEEVRLEEEAEKERGEKERREREEKMRRGEGGMGGFYRGVMDMEERRHGDAMKAVEEGKKILEGEVEGEGGDRREKEKSQKELAEEINKKGGNVVVNDDGEIVDKRALLKGGLNVGKKPKPAEAPSVGGMKGGLNRPFDSEARRGAGAGGGIGGSKAQRERQSRMVEHQLEQAAKRAADEEADERRKIEHSAKSRKTKEELSNAKERYLQRKREREEAAGKS